MLVREASDQYLGKLCDGMRAENPELFAVFLDRHPEIKVRYEAYTLTQKDRLDKIGQKHC